MRDGPSRGSQPTGYRPTDTTSPVRPRRHTRVRWKGSSRCAPSAPPRGCVSDAACAATATRHGGERSRVDARGRRSELDAAACWKGALRNSLGADRPHVVRLAVKQMGVCEDAERPSGCADGEDAEQANRGRAGRRLGQRARRRASRWAGRRARRREGWPCRRVGGRENRRPLGELAVSVCARFTPRQPQARCRRWRKCH